MRFPLRTALIHYFFVLLFLTFVITLFPGIIKAQSLGDAVVKITFGAGTATRGGAIPAAQGSTTYTYTDGEIGENYYTITNVINTAVHAGFVSSTDHTGDTGGYMMVVNGNLTAGTVFTRPVTGLCGNTQYQFGVWVKNVLTSNGILPNMVFHIYAADGVTELGSGVSTGDVPTGNVWHNYTANFTLPAGTESVIIKLVSNASGQVGNDFAVDDITFSPYGSTVAAVFNNSTSTTETTCASTPQSYTINATSTLAAGYVQKLQLNVAGTWTDLTPASTNTIFSVTSPATAGAYQYRLVSALADNVGSANCVVASNNLTINVTASPTAGFSTSGPVCLGNPVVFTDNSTADGTSITSWAWDFGDGQTATAQNPTHTYAAAGNYTVKLTVAGNNSCAPSSISQVVTVNPLPVAAFTYSTPNCIAQPVTLTDQSGAGLGTTINSWVWDYGDGATETKTANTAFQHTYATAGTYTVKLMVVNTAGCTASVAHDIVVDPLPVADFAMPDVCLSDAYAQFTNKSTVNGVAVSGLLYAWNFGDGNATSANPNTSSVQNPTHKYTKAGVYTVTLTASTASGCISAAKSQQFTVNGAVPHAGLTVDNSSTLCSSEPVVFKNTSSVDFGNITKIVFYFDYDNLPNLSETYDRSAGQIPADNKFYHSYGTFNNPATKSYHVKMIVYSGETCFDGEDINIVVHANPVVTLSSVGPLCQYDPPVQITQNTNGSTGTGVFSGDGISSTGLFNPAAASPGDHLINYTFTATGGCTYSTSQTVTVYANPILTLPSSLTVLEGGQTVINATATGTGLTYKWTPSTGLSADNVLNPVASPSDDVQYTLTVTNANGCTAAATINLSVLKTPQVPNTFTPNNDGINDNWVIKYLDSYPNCKVEIFNRYGAKLYSSVGYTVPWDGRYNGADLPAGVYYYVINPGNGRQVMSGSLTIIR